MPAGDVGEPDAVEGFRDPRSEHASRQPEPARAKRDLRFDLGIEDLLLGRLKNGADVASEDVNRRFRGCLAVHRHSASQRRKQPVEQPQEGTLPRTVAADDRDDLAAPYSETDLGENRRSAGIGERHPIDGQHIIARAHVRPFEKIAARLRA